MSRIGTISSNAWFGSTSRSFFNKSYIEGDVDFIYGRGTTVIDRSVGTLPTRPSSSASGSSTPEHDLTG